MSKNILLSIDLQYHLYPIMNHQNKLIPRFWSIENKVKINKNINIQLKSLVENVKPESVKEYLLSQAEYISKLNLESYLICLTYFTDTFNFIKSYITLDSAKKSERVVSRQIGVKHEDPSLARHAIIKCRELRPDENLRNKKFDFDSEQFWFLKAYDN